MEKTPLTIGDLGRMTDDELRATCLQYSQGCNWESADAFRYAATRLARIQGLRVMPAPQLLSAAVGRQPNRLPRVDEITASINL